MVQEYNYKGVYTYIYTDQDSYEPLAHVFYRGCTRLALNSTPIPKDF